MAIVRQEAVAEPHTGLALLLAKGGFGYDCLARCCGWWLAVWLLLLDRLPGLSSHGPRKKRAALKVLLLSSSS